mmetsp:Transcript_13466/g.29246  ORF Transcript_13466/g.29246 Transcript_13466/m.29246 type:complete len:274 (-) Transcript_13466:674-1495(-)
MSPSSSSSSKAALAAAFRSLAQGRRSARRFDPNAPPIPTSTLRDILTSTRTAPSGFNLQPAHAILVRDATIKRRLANEAMLGAGNVYRTRDCGVMAVFLADMEITNRIDRIYRLEKDGGCRDRNYMAMLPVAAAFLTGEGHAATLLKQMATDALSPVQPMPSIEPVEAWSYKNAALGAMMYTMAAQSYGLGTCMMEGYDVRRAREILRVPDRYGMPLMVATGYQYEDEEWKENEMERTPRLDMDELFFGNTFGEALDDVLLGEEENGDETEKE